MSYEIMFIFALVLVAVILFALEGIPFDVVAVIIMCSLMLSGILSLEEGFSGFSNSATVTIAAMFAISEGVRRTGALRIISGYFSKIGEMSYSLAMLIIMAVIAVISAFINNTAAVVIFIPVLMATATRMKISPSKILLPLSFASMFGGVCTLLGTSTNILVSSIAVENGLAPFSMFEFAPFGLIIMVVGFIYLFVFGIRMVPPRRKLEDLTESFHMNEYLSEVRLLPNHPGIGRRVEDLLELRDYDFSVAQLFRNEQLVDDFQEKTLEEGDILRIRGDAREIDRLLNRENELEVLPARQWKDADLASGNYQLVEAVVAPESEYDTRRLRSVDFLEQHGAVVLGIYKRGRSRSEALENMVLRGGDSLLLALGRPRATSLKKDPNFIVVSEVAVERYLTGKIPVAAAILGGVVLAAAVDLAPIALSAVTGVLLMIITGCITPTQVYRAINWKVIFLLAGVIPLGVAMQKTGAARLLSDLIVNGVGHLGPRAVLSGYFLLTTVMTAMISNQATAAILAAIAVETAANLDVAARPLLMAITFAASLSFITPWGYQTNTLIYGPGHYRFTDFTKVGLPLNIIFWILGTIFIPVIWPF